jgi:hypothetical protein
LPKENLQTSAEVAARSRLLDLIGLPNPLHINREPGKSWQFAQHNQFGETASFRLVLLHGSKLVVKRRLLITLAIVGLLAAIPLSRAGAATQTTSDVTLMSDPSVEVGTSTLTRTQSGISFSLETSGLEAGHAVTVWWMVVNPDGGVAVLYAAGHVIDDSGTAEFGGYLQVGDSAGYVMGDDTTLEDALQATVFLVVRDHGPANPRTVAAQIQTFGECNPTCTDLQVSEHQAS